MEHGHEAELRRGTSWGPFNIMAIGIIVSLIQIAAAGFWAQSPALAEDGLHEALDFVPNLIFWLTMRHCLSMREGTDRKFGAVLRGFFALTALLTIAGALFAYRRWEFHPVPVAVVLTALGGAIANLIQLIIMSESVENDSRGVQHFWMKQHIAFDAVISCGVAAAGMLSWFSPSFAPAIDTGVAVLIGIYMLFHGFVHAHGPSGKCCQGHHPKTADSMKQPWLRRPERRKQ